VNNGGEYDSANYTDTHFSSASDTSTDSHRLKDLIQAWTPGYTLLDDNDAGWGFRSSSQERSKNTGETGISTWKELLSLGKNSVQRRAAIDSISGLWGNLRGERGLARHLHGICNVTGPWTYGCGM
jgi:hypothetical protein